MGTIITYVCATGGKKNKAYNARGKKKRDHCWRKVLTGTDQRDETLMPRHLILRGGLRSRDSSSLYGKIVLVY